MPCPYPLRHRDGLFKGEVRDVMALLHTVDDEMLQSLQLCEFLFRNEVHIGAVGNVPEPESEDRKPVVHAPYRYHIDAIPAGAGCRCRFPDMYVAFAGDPFKGAVLPVVRSHRERVVIYRMDMPFRDTGVFLFRKGICVLFPQGFFYVFFTVYLCRKFFQIVERPDIIQASGMVLMVVGQKDGIEMPYPCPQHLVSEIRPGIHKYLQSSVFYECRRPQPLVSPVFRHTYFAAASYHRHSL